MSKFDYLSGSEIKSKLKKSGGLMASTLFKKLSKQRHKIEIETPNHEDGDGGLLWPVEKFELKNYEGYQQLVITVAKRMLPNSKGIMKYNHKTIRVRDISHLRSKCKSGCEIVVCGLPESEPGVVMSISEMDQPRVRVYALMNTK